MNYPKMSRMTDSPHLTQYDLFIDGRFVPPIHGRHVTTHNPANGKPLAQVADADDADVDVAITAARKAFAAWSTRPGLERGRYLYRIAELFKKRAEDFALAESFDAGRPIKQTRAIDLPRVIQTFFSFAGWADKLQYAIPGCVDPKPLGVVSQIIPWNFPLVMLANKIAPALATGNTVVLKPAPATPITAMMFAQLLIDIDLPAGVVNIITGGDKAGEQLVTHPDVDKIAFTGSTAVGRAIIKVCAGTNKKYTLELGGKGASIVFEDAPINQAIEGVAIGICYNAGQVCCAGSRLLVQSSIAPTFIEQLKERMCQFKLGDPTDPNTDIGTISSKTQHEKIQSYIQLGKQEGATLWQADTHCPTGDGSFIPPTLLLDGDQTMRVAQEEIFGPVLVVQTFDTVDQAVSLANDTQYGLANNVWTADGSRMFEMTRHLKSGVVWNNSYGKFDPVSPFGGYKASGIGREGGLLALSEYLKQGEHHD